MKKVFLFIISFSIIIGICGCIPKNVYISGLDQVELESSTLLKLNNYDNENITWSSSNPDIATVNDGLIIAKSLGEVIIYAKVGKNTFEKKITVINPVVQIVIHGRNYFYLDETYTFTCTLSQPLEKKVTWSSSNSDIIEIDADGNAIAKNIGTAIITASIYNNISTFEVSVLYPTVDLIISGKNTLYINEEYTYSCEYDGEEGVTWTSSDINILEIDNNGNAIAKKEGIVEITVSIYDSSAKFTIEVVKYKFNGSLIGPNEVKVGNKIKLEKENFSDLFFYTLKVSDENLAKISQDGTFEALKRGTVVIYACSENGQMYELKKIKILEKDFIIVIEGPNIVNKGDRFVINASTNPKDIDTEFNYSSSDPSIISINRFGVANALKGGKAIIYVTSTYDKKIVLSIEVEVKSDAPESINIKGSSVVDAGSYTNLELNVVGGINKNVKWTVSDPTILNVYKGRVLGLKEGTAKVIATSVVDDNVYGELEITVNKVNKEEYSQEDIDYVNNIINKMTLSQKVGQMFFVGFSGTSMPTSLNSAIENYNFGNVIYMGANCTSPKTLALMSNSIQNKMVSSNLVPAFISTDQEGGRVARLTSGGTHFVSQMALCATNDYNNAYFEGIAVAKELLSYGINMDFAPVLDVNNNPNNPIIGIRSYAENPVSVALYGNNVIKGFKEVGLVGCPKHFPGHGNTSVDSHYGLPKITSTLEELYAIELAPFISAIENGVDSIMTTHIIFSAIDDAYPATLSEKVLQGLLRNTLGYDGLIITDGMGMAAISSHYGTPDVSSVKAIKAGVDILLYTGLADPKTAHTAIMKAVNNNEITEERINESVRRILLTKLKYGIIENYLVTDTDRTKMLEEHAELNLTFAKQSLTQVKGTFNGLDKNKKTLIISPTTTYSLGSGLNNNSLSNYAANYLISMGHLNVSHMTVSNNISSTDASNILNNINNYDQIVVAFSNVKTSNYSRTAEFVNNLCLKHSNVIVIALDTPYDILAYNNNIKNYICIYGYQKVSVEAISMYLNGEFTATGVSPVEFK